MRASGLVTLAGFLPPWDIERRRGDVGPLIGWVLAELRQLGVEVERLERLHDAVGAAEAPALAQHLTQASMRAAPRRSLHALVREAIPELPWERVAIQATAHFRILGPGDRVSPVPLHTDFAIGHPLDEHNLWIALTAARGNAALHLAPFAVSVESDRERRFAGRLLIDPATPTEAIPVERGELLLFTPLHVHGARVVDQDVTRVSLDVRIAPHDAARARNPVAHVRLQESS